MSDIDTGTDDLLGSVDDGVAVLTLNRPERRNAFSPAMVQALGRVLADMCNVLNPDAIIVGGELSTAGEPLLVGIRESIDRYAQPAVAGAVRTHIAKLGLRAELMGAVATALTHLAHTLEN